MFALFALSLLSLPGGLIAGKGFNFGGGSNGGSAGTKLAISFRVATATTSTRYR